MSKSPIAVVLVCAISFCCLSRSAVGDEPAKSNVFVSGGEGYHTYRIPSLIVSPKGGHLLAICEGRKTGRGDHGDLDLVMKRSTDGGNTWGPLELIYEEGGTKKVTIGNPCPVVDQSTGILWMPFCRDNDDVLMTKSIDNGKTWSKPVDITGGVKDPTWGWYATGPGVGIQLSRGQFKGRLVIPCDHRVGKGRDKWNTQGHSHIIYSDDHGKTWKRGNATASGMNECQVVELADGALMLNMRSYRGKGRRAVAISKDGGITWSHPADDGTLIESVCQASLLRHTFSGNGGKGRLLFSNPATTKSRHHLTVRVSDDEGKTWANSKLLHAGPAAYSCLTVLPDESIGILYEAGNKGAYENLVFARFSLQWLKSGDEKK